MSGSETAGELAKVGPLSSRAGTEGEVAKGVTRWLVSHFLNEMVDAVRGTPFSVPLLCAIACREAGIYWLPLTSHDTPDQILALAVYDASGDVPNAPRTAFPTNTAQFRLTYGDAFTKVLIDETNNARAARGLPAAQMVYKGYGLFQYDLQAVRTDEKFFRNKLWHDFTECVSRAVGELKQKFAATGDLQEAVRAYNGSGPNAEQYARDVMRLLPFCEEAAAEAAPRSAPVLSKFSFAALRAMVPSPNAMDPAAPASGEISDTADLDTARVLVNLGAPVAPETAAAPAARGMPDLLTFDLDAAKHFLQACMTSHPRVTYGLGKKVPFHGAVPGRDFTQVDCSGFVREAVRLATHPMLPFPDGSVVQHDWVRAQAFAASSVIEAGQDDDLVRIAFLRPQDAPSRIGHVVLISAGMTLESTWWRRAGQPALDRWRLASQSVRLHIGARVCRVVAGAQGAAAG